MNNDDIGDLDDIASEITDEPLRFHIDLCMNVDDKDREIILLESDFYGSDFCGR